MSEVPDPTRDPALDAVRPIEDPSLPITRTELGYIRRRAAQLPPIDLSGMTDQTGQRLWNALIDRWRLIMEAERGLKANDRVIEALKLALRDYRTRKMWADPIIEALVALVGQDRMEKIVAGVDEEMRQERLATKAQGQTQETHEP